MSGAKVSEKGNNMKVVWEDADIVVGRRYTKPGTNEVWLIGYRVDIEPQDQTKGPKRFVQISLNDGMCCCDATAADIALALTHQGYVPLELAKA